MRKFRYGKLSVPIAQHGLGPRSPERGTRSKQKAKIVFSVVFIREALGGREKARQIDEGRNACFCGLRQERAPRPF